MKKKRLVFLIPSMTNGGAERVVATLSNEFVKSCDVTIITLTGTESFYSLGDSVHYKSANISLSSSSKIKRKLQLVIKTPKAICYLIREINKIKPTIIISFLTTMNIFSMLVRKFYPNTKFIISERNDPLKRNQLLQRVIGSLYMYSDALVCQSEQVKKIYKGFGISNIYIIPNPININTLPQKLDFKSRENVIIAVGRLYPQKNFPILLKGFAGVVKKYPNYRLEIFGEGPERANIENIIKELALTKNVILHGVKKDVFKLANYAQFYVMTSDYEGFPNSLIEAMASGLPVISTDFSTGVAKELIGENNGYLIEVGNQEQLKNAIIAMIEDPIKRKEMSKLNWKIREEFASEIISRKWLDLFLELM